MQTEELKKYQKRLLELKQQTADAGTASVKAEYEKLPSDILDEDSQPLSEMNQVIASNRNQHHAMSLEKINTALRLIESSPNDFGLCLDCGDPISSKRLELMPYIDLCVTCQQERDKANKPGRRKHLTDYK